MRNRNRGDLILTRDEEVANRQTCEEYQIPVPFWDPGHKDSGKPSSAYASDDDSSDSSFSLPDIDYALPSKSTPALSTTKQTISSKKGKLGQKEKVRINSVEKKISKGKPAQIAKSCKTLSKIGKTSWENSLMLPVYFNIQKKKEILAQKIQNNSSPLMRAASVSSPQNTTTRGNSRKPKVTVCNGTIRQKKSPSPIELVPDPEMPVLEKIVCHTEAAVSPPPPPPLTMSMMDPISSPRENSPGLQSEMSELIDYPNWEEFEELDSLFEADDNGLFSFEHLSLSSNVSPELTPDSLEIDDSNSQVMIPPPPAERSVSPIKFPANPIPIPSTSTISNDGDDNHTQSQANKDSVEPSEILAQQFPWNKNTFDKAVDYFSQLMSKELSMEKRRERSLSPDICWGPRPKARKQIPKILQVIHQIHHLPVIHQMAEALLSDEISRDKTTRVDIRRAEEYRPPIPVCHFRVYPDYARKREMYEIHCKNIRDLDNAALKIHFTAISDDILLISKGVQESKRHQMYLDLDYQKKELYEMNLFVPFNLENLTVVTELIYDLLGIIDQKERYKLSFYVNFVMLPESLVRIYALANAISVVNAEKEMRFGGCYYGGESIQ